MKVILLFLSGLLFCAVGHSQQKSFGYRISGAGSLFSNACLVQEGFVLDSASYILDPSHLDTHRSYRFEYNQQGKLVSDSNLTFRADPYLVGRFTYYYYRARRSQYFYNEKGAVDSIAYAYWIDSVWVSDSTFCKLRYTSDEHLSSKVYTSPMGSYRMELYAYDASGNPILDSVIVPGNDTSYTRRQFDTQNRMIFSRSSLGPDSLNFNQTLYRYDTSGNIHCTNQQATIGTLSNVSDDLLTFDESGKVTKQSESTYFNPADSTWGSYHDSFFTYDSHGKMLTYGDYVWFVYDANGNLDTLVDTHVPSFAAEVVDAYGNVITLPNYSGTTSYFYHALVTGIQTRETPGMTFSLAQNYPNPFNPSTKIQFTIVNRQLTMLKVYDILGREVTTLVNEVKGPGRYTVQFDARNLASGVYFYRLQAGSFVETKKLLLVR